MDKELENCICRHCAFADSCPSAYFPINKKQCADLFDMRKKKEGELVENGYRGE